MPLVINDTTPQDQYTATSGQTDFTISFEFFAVSDIKVYNGDAVLSYNASPSSASQYSVTGAGSNSTKKITLGSPGATTGDVITILRDIPVARTSDFPTSGPFAIDTLNTELDTLTAMVAERENEIVRCIRAPENDPSGINLVLPSKASRAGKTLAFDSTTGDPVVGDEIGNYRGDWAASTSYLVRDLVKDTSTNNIFRAKTAHTSSGSQPLTTNTDSAKWDLIVDAASASASATAAAASATAAASSATASATSATSSASSATSAATAQTAAETAQAAAETAQAAAELAADNFDDTYLGAKASDPTVDNDGDALTSGDLYFNTTSNELKVYNGSAWQVAAVSAAGLLAASNNLSDVASAATARTNLGVAIGTDVQAFDADNAVTDAAQTFTVSQRGTITTDNDLSFDLNATNNFKCTPSGSGTLTFTNHTAGQSGNILLINTGGHAISLAATTKGDANLATTISTAGTYWLSYYDDGTNAYVVTSTAFA